MATAAAALNRNRNQSTGLRLSSVDIEVLPLGCEELWMGLVAGWRGQMPAWASAAPAPFLVIRAMAAPASATTAPTRKALCIPAVKVAWLIWVMAAAACAGVPRVTGATPTETALLTWA